MVFAAGILTLAIAVWFYGFVPRYGTENSRSVFGWLGFAGATRLYPLRGYPLSLVLFLVLHSIFLGGVPWKKKVEDQLHHKVSEKS